MGEQVVTAKIPGMCGECGQAIYIGNKIVVRQHPRVHDMTIAMHALCVGIEADREKAPVQHNAPCWICGVSAELHGSNDPALRPKVTYPHRYSGQVPDRTKREKEQVVFIEGEGYGIPFDYTYDLSRQTVELQHTPSVRKWSHCGGEITSRGW